MRDRRPGPGIGFGGSFVCQREGGNAAKTGTFEPTRVVRCDRTGTFEDHMVKMMEAWADPYVQLQGSMDGGGDER